MAMPEIETARLRLRYFTVDDFDTLFRLYSDAEDQKKRPLLRSRCSILHSVSIRMADRFC